MTTFPADDHTGAPHMRSIVRPVPLAAVAALLVAALPAAAQHAHPAPSPTPAPAAASGRFPEIAPGYYFVADSAGNLVVGTGSEGTLIVGPQEPSGLARVRQLMDSLRAGPVRYVVATSGDSAVRWADGGWSARGATVFAHEGIRNRMRRPRGAVVVGAVPRFGYSNVVQLDFNGEDVHVVHHPGGYSNADAIVHFETNKFLYLGTLFTSDGYPAIDVAREGTISGLIRSASEFIENYESDPSWIEPIVPGRGPLATFADLRAYRDMLVAVRERVRTMVAAGRTADEAVAARPTAEFDARWGRGPIKPDAFVRRVHWSVRQEAAVAAAAAAASAFPAAPAPAPNPPAPGAAPNSPAPVHQHGKP
ncbi:MAG TPA: hypothetical protein VGB92_18310 [Longimicrobium sp.]|jgi:hypothetical protein